MRACRAMLHILPYTPRRRAMPRGEMMRAPAAAPTMLPKIFMRRHAMFDSAILRILCAVCYVSRAARCLRRCRVRVRAICACAHAIVYMPDTTSIIFLFFVSSDTPRYAMATLARYAVYASAIAITDVSRVRAVRASAFERQSELTRYFAFFFFFFSPLFFLCHLAMTLPGAAYVPGAAAADDIYTLLVAYLRHARRYFFDAAAASR